MSLTVRVVAPIGRDAELIVALLQASGVAVEACPNALDLIDSLSRPNTTGADDSTIPPLGPLVLTEESLTSEIIDRLAKFVRSQPTWSDLPLLILTTGGRTTLHTRMMEQERIALGSPVLLERPIRTETLVSSIRAAVRARERQYQVRDALVERDRILAELRSEREILRVMLDNLPVGVILAQVSGEIIQTNAAVEQIFRHPILPTTDVKGHGEWVSFHADGSRVQADEYPLVRAIKSGNVIPPESFLYQRGDGTQAWVNISAAPIRNQQGKIVSGVAAIVDIDDRKRAESALIQSEKLAAVGRLAASISHEINNPLEAITNLLYLMRQEENLPQKATTYLSLAERELARVSQIAGQTLRFHRQSTNPTSVTAEDLLDSVVALYQGRLLNAHITLDFEHLGTSRITCYEGDIRQVLNNLVGNAIDSMRKGGKLLIRTHDATCWRTGRPGIRITTADTGSGMSPEVRARIFEAFYTTKGLSGTGLGLWISHGIIEKHHGILNVRSRSEAESAAKASGTVFSLFLPRDLQLAA
jgi:PAS domain S-box-containing protein